MIQGAAASGALFYCMRLHKSKERPLSEALSGFCELMGLWVYALKELPQPQVDFTLGLLNLNPDPSSVST